MKKCTSAWFELLSYICVVFQWSAWWSSLAFLVDKNQVKKAVGWRKRYSNMCPDWHGLKLADNFNSKFQPPASAQISSDARHNNLAHWLSSGTYFNCIMFMVASSVVTTIMILNYHHRLADTHEMPSWVSYQPTMNMEEVNFDIPTYIYAVSVLFTMKILLVLATIYR